MLWEENGVPPILTLEVVSQTPGGEYDEKPRIYTQLGVVYYVVYNPQFWKRDEHLPFEVYKLVNGVYELQIGRTVLDVGDWVGNWTLSVARRSTRARSFELVQCLW